MKGVLSQKSKLAVEFHVITSIEWIPVGPGNTYFNVSGCTAIGPIVSYRREEAGYKGLGLVVRRSAGRRKDAGSTPRLGSPFSSQIVIDGHCLVTLPCTD